MTFWEELGSNQVLISSVIGWTAAQLLKTIIDMRLNKSFKAERLVGSGGMPSSHSSTVCALTTSAALVYGVSSFEFAICFILAAVVMYDAMGVRREAGKQARLLNLILEQDFLKLDNGVFQQNLKELIGHTPLQVLAGAILGIILAFVVDGYYA
ncbi:divergent PAP2 family protein [Lachnospiraceae bacterium 62-35]